MSELRIATRRSALALAQARSVAAALGSAHPGMETSLVEVTTTGDRDRRSSVTALTEVGAFVRAVQERVLEGSADLAVHSAKDLPVDGPESLRVYYPAREAAWDVLCGSGLSELAPGARVGTGSPRRTAQLARLRPDLRIDEIRGNVDTRLRKVEEGAYGAVVLAEAGLRRLGVEARIGYRFPVEEMVPAPGQGALAVEVVAGSPAEEMVRRLDHEATRRAVEAERSLLAATRAGCRAALGVHATAQGDRLRVDAFVEDGDGARTARVEGRDQEVLGMLRAGLGL